MKRLGFLAWSLILVTPAVCQEAEPKGLWEGEIEIPRSPIVVSVDFDKRQGRLSSARATAFPLTDLKSEAGEIRFDLRLRNEVGSFHARHGKEGLRGTATFADMQGKILAQGGFLLRRIADLTTAHSREQAWRQDLDVVLARFLPYDRSFTDTTRIAFRQRIGRLKDSVARSSDAELMVELARAVALSHNAHTRLYLVRNRTEMRRLPIRVWWFRDGCYVVRATEEYKDLLGCRVARIGETEVSVAAEKVDGIKAGNRSWQRYMSSYMLTSPEILSGSHVIADSDRIPLELHCGQADEVCDRALALA